MIAKKLLKLLFRTFLGFCLVALILCPVAFFFTPLIFRSVESIDPIDIAQFRTERNPLTDDTPNSEILPAQVGRFARIPPLSSNVDEINRRQFDATYQTQDGEKIWLSLSRLPENATQILHRLLSNGQTCGDCVGIAQVDLTAATPYGYAVCGCWGFRQDTFNWTNGYWLLTAGSATTLKSDGEMLLEFVNSYPF